MASHLQKEIEKIKKEILSLGAMVEDRFKKAVYAIKTEDLKLAQTIIDTDFEVDEREIEVEEECLKILALYQPVAMDLRFLVAVVKINNDLERIADYAANISKRFKASSENPNKFRYDYTAMGEQTAKMLRMSLDALVKMDVDMAYEVRDMDSDVNIMRNDAYDSMKEDIQKHPEMVGEIINMYLISRHLERIGDHTTNIAEEVIYLIEGEIIRHT
ncbi:MULTISPECIES: phosphate signaling complex protein PhoU [Desulfobacula]|uniref:Phosphate-specific transport system accessory protein PhoU n=2 Tax=Desulfobacula TaxID=28222 RepID=K0NR50_DESTT|nr:MULTISPECIES: phosphate signaling complex protein PhoU [Desulfobacula]CCK81407.1 PhoU2: phosphate transport system protein [Desulfobacula toluolica Tol2]SDU28355.1 phosphate transport system protein [Desulfobacula phenolica]